MVNVHLPQVVLLTDFGLDDAYVGIMKGVMRSICASVQFIDLTHAVQPFHIRQAAWILGNALQFMPEDAVFLCVVDPGVGSSRKPIAVRTPKHFFVGPDNGLFTAVLLAAGNCEIRVVTNPALMLDSPGHTFHGRDIFAPVAAYLAQGTAFEFVGEYLTDEPVLLHEFAPEISAGYAAGEIMTIDQYGTAITNIGPATWTSDGKIELAGNVLRPEYIVLNGLEREFAGILRTFSDVERHFPIMLIGSSQTIELGMREGNAAQRFGWRIGDRVTLKWSE